MDFNWGKKAIYLFDGKLKIQKNIFQKSLTAF